MRLGVLDSRSRSSGKQPKSTRTVLIANPSSDVYGSDLQMLQSVIALHERGWRVVVAAPERGRLTSVLEAHGAEIRCVPCPVLRRSSLSPKGALELGSGVAAAVPRLVREIRTIGPDVVYVNTETIPWWLPAARVAGVRTVCHVHEAEAQDSRMVRLALNLPLLMANAIVTISRPAVEAIGLAGPRSRAHLIYNGVPRPDRVIEPPASDESFKLAVIGRLSPRKAPHVALEAVSIARRRGYDVTLDVCGTPFSGYEWYEEELKKRARRPDLDGAVRFVGYVSPIWPALERVQAVLAPSLREPFGNAVVEAQLARRPVVAAAAMGHLETVIHDETGLLVDPGDAVSMAGAIERLIVDPGLREELAKQAELRALDLFAIERYRSEIAELVASTVGA